MAITTAQFFVIGNAQKMATRVHILISLKLQKISFIKNRFSIFHSITFSGQVNHLAPK